MVQERARAALRVLNEETAAGLDPYLGVCPADDFALEGEFVGARRISSGDTHTGPVCEPSNAQRCVALADVATNGVEPQRAAGVEMWHETDAVRGACGLIVVWCADGGTGGGRLSCACDCDDGHLWRSL